MEHVTVRRSSETDIDSITQLYEDAAVYSQTLQLPFPSRETWRKRLTDVAPTLYNLVAELDGEIAGCVTVEPLANLRRRHAGNIAIAVKGAVQGRGIGNRLMSSAMDLADNWMNLQRLELTVFADNEKAIALYKKHGFVVEGEMTNYAYRNGRYINAYSMARMKTHGI